MKKSYLVVIIITLILLIAVLTNPNPERHREAVKTEINAYMQKTIKDNGSEAEGQALGALLGGALIDRMVESVVSTSNYLIFSTTKVTWEGKTRVIGFGVFGNVYITGQVKEN